MKTCISHKKIYLTQEIAEDALVEARVRFDYTQGDGPVAVYKCDDCGYYHLTSQGQMNGKLAQYYAEGKIQRQKEADYWLNKMKRR